MAGRPEHVPVNLFPAVLVAEVPLLENRVTGQSYDRHTGYSWQDMTVTGHDSEMTVTQDMTVI